MGSLLVRPKVQCSVIEPTFQFGLSIESVHEGEPFRLQEGISSISY